MKKITKKDFAFRSDLRSSELSPLRSSNLARSDLRAFSLDKFVIFQRADYSLEHGFGFASRLETRL